MAVNPFAYIYEIGSALKSHTDWVWEGPLPQLIYDDLVYENRLSAPAPDLKSYLESIAYWGRAARAMVPRPGGLLTWHEHEGWTYWDARTGQGRRLPVSVGAGPEELAPYAP